MPHSKVDSLCFLKHDIEESAIVLANLLESVSECFEILIDFAEDTLKLGGKIIFFGNGGSAAGAQHIATELMVKFHTKRAALPAITLNTDCSILTAIGNDFSFDEIFSRQIEALAQPGDLAVAFSTSGNSENVVRGLMAAQQFGCIAVCFTGKDGGKMKQYPFHLLRIPSMVTARIQEMHLLLGHAFCKAVENRLFGINPINNVEVDDLV